VDADDRLDLVRESVAALATMAKAGSGDLGDWRGEAALLAKEVAGLDHWLTAGDGKHHHGSCPFPYSLRLGIGSRLDSSA
jgi:hypothetical protein